VQGSGFIVNSGDGYIVTATHVIANAYRNTVEVKFRNGKTQSALVVANFGSTDVSLLATEPTRFPALPFQPSLSSASYAQGSNLVDVGMVGDAYRWASGPIKLAHQDNAGWTVLTTDGPAVQGMSGGPVLDSCGQGIGMLSLGGVGGDPIVVIALSQPGIDALVQFAESIPAPTPTPIPTPTPVPLRCSDDGCVIVSAVNGVLGDYDIGADVNGRLSSTSNKALIVCPTAIIFDAQGNILRTGTGPYGGIRLRAGESLPVTIHVYGRLREGTNADIEVRHSELGAISC
jgi:hypothetical protein